MTMARLSLTRVAHVIECLQQFGRYYHAQREGDSGDFSNSISDGTLFPRHQVVCVL